MKSKCIIPLSVEVELDSDTKELLVEYLKSLEPDTPIKYDDEETFNALRTAFIDNFINGEWNEYYGLNPTDIAEYCYNAYALDGNIIDQFVDFVCNVVLPEFTKTVAKYYKNRIQIARVD